MQVQVRTTAAGGPLRVEVGGRTYRVAADPWRWYERRPWWEWTPRAPQGACPHLVDREVWQLQVAPERPAAARRRQGPVPEAELRTLRLERDQDTGTWTVLEGEALEGRGPGGGPAAERIP